MHPQIISSLAAAMFVALAAVLLNSPGALLLLALACMFAWLSHTEGTSYRWRFLTTYTALAVGVLAALLLVFRII